MIRSDEGLALETSAIVPFTAFHYPHQHTVDTPVHMRIVGVLNLIKIKARFFLSPSSKNALYDIKHFSIRKLPRPRRRYVRTGPRDFMEKEKNRHRFLPSKRHTSPNLVPRVLTLPPSRERTLGTRLHKSMGNRVL